MNFRGANFSKTRGGRQLPAFLRLQSRPQNGIPVLLLSTAAEGLSTIRSRWVWKEAAGEVFRWARIAQRLLTPDRPHLPSLLVVGKKSVWKVVRGGGCPIFFTRCDKAYLVSLWAEMEGPLGLHVSV